MCIVAAVLSILRWPALYAAYVTAADVSIAEQPAQFSLFKRTALAMLDLMVEVLTELTAVVSGL